MLKIFSFVVFVLAALIYKLNTRKVYYNRIVLSCLALALPLLASYIDKMLMYFFQLLFLAVFAHFGNQYYKEGFFRRRKELHNIVWRAAKKEHKDFKPILYPHLKDLELRELKIEKDLAKINRLREELRQHALELRNERYMLEKEKKTLRREKRRLDKK